jgi:hypothetical protein
LFALVVVLLPLPSGQVPRILGLPHLLLSIIISYDVFD